MKKTSLILLPIPLLTGITAYLLSGGNPEASIKAVLSALLILSFLCAVRRSPEKAALRSGRFSGAEASAAASDIRFSDVAANEEALQSLRELADFLKDPDKYTRMGARMPRGVLLYGPPGTGKTLLARALAGEADVPIYPLAGSDFVEMYAGVGAGRVRDLFRKARKTGKCVIFIDEIDALGKRRGESSSDEREQTLNALLSEMSGFREGDGIIVLAATNRIETLDPALTRPGRFDRHIEVGLPERNERLDIIRLHTRSKPLDASVDLEGLAESTIRFSGAALESLLNEAALLAVRRGSERIEQADIDAAYIASVAGRDRPSRTDRRALAAVALHEAGHAIASLCLTPEHKITRISILPSSRGAAGYNLTIPPERLLVGRMQLNAQIQVLLAGRAAEMLISGAEEGLTSGAANDLSRAAELAAAMVLDLGMADEPAVSLRPLQKLFGGGSDGLAMSRDILARQLQAVTELLTRHTDELMRLTEALLEEESINQRRLMELLPHMHLNPPAGATAADVSS